jgi:type I restriction enzyme S subunit
MSSDGDDMAAETGGQRVLTPKLRFPEFRHAEGWRLAVLAAACDMQAGKFVPASDIAEHDEAGLFPCYGGNGLRGYTKTYTHEGTYPLIGRQGALCGNVKLVDGRFHATEHAVVATPREAVEVGWLYFVLDLLNLNRFATGQAQPGLSVDVLEKVPLAIPKLVIEQQKIADCMSAVDALIAEQARKVEALKAHKKGLMQQLFPREGETQPRLRFPEFQDAGEWEVITLGTVCDIQRGKFSHRPRDDPRFFGGKYPFIQTGDVVKSRGGPVVASQSLNEEGLAVSKLFQPTIVLVTIAANIGDTGLLRTAGCFTDSVVGLIPKGGVIPVFLELIMRGQKEYLNKVATPGAQKNINNEILRDVSVLLPSVPEQQRIADCLTSLDDLIAAQTQKFDALKTHKKGLMQQLFPSMEETTAP